MAWPYLKILQNNSVDDTEQDGEKDRRRDGKTTSKNGQEWVWRFPEGDRKQEKVERYCCNIIFDAPTTV